MSGRVDLVSSRFCSEIVLNLTGTAKTFSIALVWRRPELVQGLLLFVEGVSYQLETEECDPFGETFTQSEPVLIWGYSTPRFNTGPGR